jgi:hypothetical protein
MKPPVYELRLRPLPDPGDPAGYRRVRALLKRMLRGYGLRVVSIRPGNGKQASNNDGGDPAFSGIKTSRTAD